MAICSSSALHLIPSAPTATTHHRLAAAPPFAGAPPHISCLSIHRPSQHCRRIKNTRPLSALLRPHTEEHLWQAEEEEEDLIGAIRDELASIEAGVKIESESLLDALVLVDLTKRLGIERYFEHHLQKILTSIYMKWDEKRGLHDADATVLAFRLLRLHGYPVSTDVIEALKDGDKGFFTSFSATTPTNISSLLNLYRCSQTSFPCESKIMNEAREMARSQLHILLLEKNSTLLETNNLRMEIEFAMDYPRRCLMPRLESRCMVRQLWPGNSRTHKYLKLAKLDLNMLQKLHRQELEEVERWWMQQGFGAIECARGIQAKTFFAVVPTMFEPKFSAYRLAFTKTVCLLFIMDDLFDDKSYNLEELHRFTEATKRWDPSLIDDLPQYKLVLTSICNEVSGFAKEYYKLHGCDTLPLLKDLWVSFTVKMLTEAEWVRSHHIPTFEEYMKLANRSIGVFITSCTSMFSLGEVITAEIWSHIGTASPFVYHAGFAARLLNDLTGYEREAREGKVANAIDCYLNDNPQLTQEEAIASIEGLIESSCQELELELYRSRAVVPECCSRASLNCVRTAFFAYKSGDAFTNSVEEHLQLFKDYLFGSLD